VAGAKLNQFFDGTYICRYHQNNIVDDAVAFVADDLRKSQVSYYENSVQYSTPKARCSKAVTSP